MSEVHLFIIWQNALDKKEEIIKDIKKNFDIIQIYKMNWSKELFSQNLSRFYGTNLPKGSGKEEHCGNGPFLLVVVKDNNPRYELRDTTQGKQNVNKNMFDKKTEYRELTGGGHKIHATNSVKETNHDLTLLLGLNVDDYLKQGNNSDEIIELTQDVIGSNGWKDAKEMFYALNNCCEYAVLRNYETLPEEIYINDHNDIDLICISYENCAYVLNAKKVFEEDYRIHYKTNVEDRVAYFDLRYIGDSYYCEPLEKNLLENRIYNDKGFYTISQDEYFYTLLYHAILHKNNFSDDYKIKLKNMNSEYSNTEIKNSLELLENWLIKNEYFVTIPIDKSVLFNRENAAKLSKLVYRNEIMKIELEEENKLLQNENNKLKDKIEEMNKELNAIYSSRSWRSTQILRNISKTIKKRKE